MTLIITYWVFVVLAAIGAATVAGKLFKLFNYAFPRRSLLD